MEKETKVELGDIVQDPISGLVGTVVAITEWLVGCRRITIQPKAKKGEVAYPDSFNMDEPIAKIVKRAKPQKKVNRETGGPIPTMKRWGTLGNSAIIRGNETNSIKKKI